MQFSIMCVYMYACARVCVWENCPPVIGLSLLTAESLMEQIKMRRHLNEGQEQVERYHISHDYRSLMYRYFSIIIQSSHGYLIFSRFKLVRRETYRARDRRRGPFLSRREK